MEPGRPSKIIIKVPNYAGDVVMCLPALHAIRRLFPHAAGHQIHLLLHDRLVDLFHRQDCYDRLLPGPWDSSMRSTSRAVQFLKASAPYGLSFSFTREWPFARAFKKLRIPIRFGYSQFDMNLWLTHTVKSPQSPAAYNGSDHIDHYFALPKLAARLADKGAPERMEPALHVNPDLQQEAYGILARSGAGKSFYTVVAGSSKSDPHKRWPLENYLTVAREVCSSRPDLTSVFLFGPDESDLYDQCRRLCPDYLPLDRIAALAPGQLRWSHILAILAGSEFVLTNDTGPRHAAVALGKPVVCIFGPTDDKWVVYRTNRERLLKIDAGCNRTVCTDKRCSQAHVCMTSITPTHVLRAIEELLSTT